MTTTDHPSKPANIFQISDQDNEKYFRRAEWEALVISAFPKAEKIDLRKRFSGYSVAQTWWVVTKIGKDSGLYVIKIASKHKIDDEANRIVEYVNGSKLYGTPVKPEQQIDSTDGRWSLLVFSFAGYEKTYTLLDYYNDSDPAHIEQILNNVFGHRSDRNNAPYPIYYHQHYDRLLPAHFEFVGLATDRMDDTYTISGPAVSGKLRQLYEELSHETKPIQLESFRVEKNEKGVLTLCPDQPTTDDSFTVRIKYELTDKQRQDTAKITFPIFASHPKTRNEILTEIARKVMDRDLSGDTFKFGPSKNVYTYPNPIKYLAKLLYKEDWLMQGTIHGDLNLQNILLSFAKTSAKQETGSKHPTEILPKDFLIDFADTRLGPILLDFQWLEVNVILWILAPAIKKDVKKNLQIVTDFLKALHNEAELPPNLEALNKPYAFLRVIRLYAKPYLQNNWKEYYRGLVIALVGSLRFRNSIPVDDYALRVTFLCAATVLCWSDILLPEELKKISPDLQILEIKTIASPPSEPPITQNRQPLLDEHEDDKKLPVPVAISIPQKKSYLSRREFLWLLLILPLGFTIWLLEFYRKALPLVLVNYWDTLRSIVMGIPPLPPKKIRIGVALASRGDGSLLGEAQWIGYDVAAQYFASSLREIGLEIDLLNRDAKSTEYDALVVFKDLIDKKVVAIIGPTYSKQIETLFHAQTIKDLFKDKKNGEQVKALFGNSSANVDAFVKELQKIPIIGPSNTADDIAKLSPYNLRVSAPVAKYADFALTTVTNTFKIKNIAIAYLDDPFTYAEAKVFREAVQNDSAGLGLELVFDQSYQSESFDDKQFVGQFVKNILNTKPDLVIILGRPPHGAAMVKQLREPSNHYQGKIIGGNGMNAPGIFKLSEGACDGMYIAQAYNYALDNPINKAFRMQYDTYRKGLQKDNHDLAAANLPYPSQLTAQMFTAVQILVEAIKQVEPALRTRELDALIQNDKAPQDLRKAVLDQMLGHTFETPLGQISFNAPEGEIAQDVFCVAQLQAGNNQPQFKRIRNSGNNCREPEPEQAP